MSQVYSNDFNPLMLPNETAVLKGSAFPDEGQPVRCLAVGGLPEYTKNFGALTAATWSLDNADTSLDMGPGELAQYRMRVMGDFKLQIKNPSATQQWRTLNANFFLRKFPQDTDEDFLKVYLWKVSEFCVYGNDNSPRFDLYGDLVQATSRVIFNGWRFKLQNIAKAQLTSRVEIWVNSWPSGTGK